MNRGPDELPPWKPRAGAETRRFIDWTIARWDDLHAQYDLEEDAWREAYLTNPANAKQITPRVFPDFPLILALSDKDEEKFVRLMRDPAQARLAFRMLTSGKKKRRRGRPKSDDTEHYLDWPSQITVDIEHIWNRHYRKWRRRRDNPPSVFKIAAEILKREGLKIPADKIQAHRRKHGKP